jgi:excisionase family DNA binding protein
MIHATIAPVEYTEAHEMASENERQDGDMSAWITVKQAAELLGVSDRRIRQMLDSDLPDLHGMRVGEGRRAVWLVNRKSVEAAKNRPGAWKKELD